MSATNFSCCQNHSIPSLNGDLRKSVLRFVVLAIAEFKTVKKKTLLSLYQSLQCRESCFSYRNRIMLYKVRQFKTKIGPDYDGGKHETSPAYFFVFWTLIRKGRRCWFYKIGSSNPSTSRYFGTRTFYVTDSETASRI